MWQTEEWLIQVKQWIADVLGQRAMTIIGEVEQVYLTPGATVLRIPTDKEDFYFKAVEAACAAEVVLAKALADWYPADVLPVLHIDQEQGWMLMPDGGERVREAFGGELTYQHWADILTGYARLQINLIDHTDDLLALGTRDRRLFRLPDLYAHLLTDRHYLLLDQEDGITTAEYERLIKAMPQVSEMCRQLGEYAIPDSLHHNDLHDGNIFVQAGRYRFFDWGDSSVSHPFFSLRTAFVSVENRFDLAETDPIFEDLAHAYLQPWVQFESESNLRQAYGLSRRLWSLSSAVKYKTLLGLVPALREEYEGAIPALLQEFLAVNSPI